MKIIEFFDNDKEFNTPYFIAEIGVNHEGSIDTAKQLIDEAKESGAHAAKFQAYKANTIASKNSPSYWDTSQEKTTSQHALFSKYDSFSEKEYEKLKLYCDEVEIEFMSTPFDEFSAEFLNDLVPAFKIASADLTNKLLIEQIDSFQKPIILSTGASYSYEIERSLSWIKKSPVSLLHCVLNYPTKDENANLSRINFLKNKYPDIMIGYSDHTFPSDDMKVLITSYLLGARIIEKHFTNDKTLPGNDHYHSADKQDVSNFFSELQRVKNILGNASGDTPLESEFISRKNARRSLYLKQVLKKGEAITKENLIPKRPGGGIGPEFYDEIIGKKVKSTLDNDTPLTWDQLTD